MTALTDTPFTLVRGDTPSFTITITPADLRLLGTHIRFTARDREGTLKIEKDNAALGGITVPPDNPGSIAKLTLTAADTTDIAAPATLNYDVELTEPNGQITTVARGELLIQADIST